MLALLLIAAGLGPAPLAPAPLAPGQPAQQQSQPIQPWLEIAAGPQLGHQSGSRGVRDGPLVRLSVGAQPAESFGAELWVSGALLPSPVSAPGDGALAAGGVSGRARVWTLDPGGRLALWARAGVGWQAAVAGPLQAGPAGFAGAQLLFQPFVRRFALGLEIDGLAGRGATALALLPTLRCAL